MADNTQSPQEQADAMMARINRTALGKTVLISAGLHLALIAVTSIPFIILCGKYQTLDPGVIQARLASELVETPTGDDASKVAAETPTPEKPVKVKETPISNIEKIISEVDNNPPPASKVTMDPLDIPE